MSALAPNPCGSCPYRRDVPSGVWAPEEYLKLPPYDAATIEDGQPLSAFFCHQQDGKLCAGWVAVNDMDESIGLRLAVAHGLLTQADYEEALDYETDTPLFESGAAACEHGLAKIGDPEEDAQQVIEKLERRQLRRGGKV